MVAVSGEILLGDGLVLKLFFEDGLDFRKTVKPVEELGPDDIVVETAIELFADFDRQSEDFTLHRQ